MKKNITVCQYHTDNIDYASYSSKINKDYCEFNGYEYFLESDTELIKESVKFPERTFHWYKILQIKKALDKYPSSDYIFFLDIDAIFLNKERRIEEFINDEFTFLLSEDYGPSIANTGVIMVKNCSLAKDLLDRWWNLAEENPDYKTAIWHEQTCLKFLMEEVPYKSIFKIIDNSDINSRIFDKSRFIFHAFGYGDKPFRTLDSAHDIIYGITDNLSLSAIAKEFPTDKDYEHNYLDGFYEELFSPLKDKEINFCEIADLTGDSLRIWEKYFPKANILGLNINAPDGFNEKKGRVRIDKFDQSNKKSLKKYSKQIESQDIILDDGSHKMRDQQITFAKFFRRLKPGGIYIIEDLHTSLEVHLPEKAMYQWGDPNKTDTLKMLKDFQDFGEINSDYMSDNDIKYLKKNIDSVEIFNKDEQWSITSAIKKKDKITEAIDKDSDVEVIKKEKTKNKIAVVQYCWAVNNWQDYLTEELELVKSSGLSEEADELYLFVSDSDGVGHARPDLLSFDPDSENNGEGKNESKIKDLMSKYPKYKLEYTTRNFGGEFTGPKKVHELSRLDEDYNVLYFHTKGVFNKYKNFFTGELSQIKIDSIKCWRRFLQYFVIENWRDCVEKLKEFDVVGANRINVWFEGNFWWTKSSHLRKCRPYEEFYSGSRWCAEAWIIEDQLNRGIKDISTYEFFYKDFNPYSTNIPDYFYKKDKPKKVTIKINKALYGWFAEQNDEGRAHLQKGLELGPKIIDVTKLVLDQISESPSSTELPLETLEQIKPDWRAFNFDWCPERTPETSLRIFFSTNIEPEKEYFISTFSDSQLIIRPNCKESRGE